MTPFPILMWFVIFFVLIPFLILMWFVIFFVLIRIFMELFYGSY